jgi:putative membrane-bound dehydrogenase-like protein
MRRFSPLRIARLASILFLCLAALHTDGQHSSAAAANPAVYQVGLAKVDITPEGPIRLSGFYVRKTESVGVREHIFARAMAVAGIDKKPVVLITVDSIGIPVHVRNEVAHRLAEKKGLPNERLAITATHCHTTPMLTGVLTTMFGEPVPPDQQARIDKYTKDLTDELEQVAAEALGAMKPARLQFGIGEAGFSINRRTKGGPVDHELPVLQVTDLKGKIRAVYVSYACHCVVLSDFKTSGDWAGYAAADIEKKYPGCIALVSVGCGADSNPACGVQFDKAEFAQKYAEQMATEVDRVFHTMMGRLDGNIECQLQEIKLPLHKLPSRAEWEQRAKIKGPEGYYAQVQLDQLDAGKKLATEVTYPVQTWKFGNTLAMVFLSGEVVVDYSIRLKKELDSTRLWVNAYSNDDPAYIPSERILKEGGYEGGGAMVYYNLPAPFAAGLEDKIVSAVHAQLDDSFKAHDKKQGTQGNPPRKPAESLAKIQVRPGMRVELVASEPAIQSPTSIDFGPDGKVWVSQALDYGCKDGETCPPSGRVSFLEDRDGDGKFETATVFLDKIAEPFGVTVWGKGVLISAAPDLIYAEDTNGDGKADVVQKLFTGFSTENPQGRINTMCYGLDGWLEAGSYQGSKLKSLNGQEIMLPNGDFRLQPDLQKIDHETGQTENGRVRDDWGNWFGTDNSNVCFHYPLFDRYLRRNPHILPPPLTVYTPTPAASQLHPRGKLILMPLSGPAGHATAACGMGFYRDELLGKEFTGNSFTCEPVNQLVHRMVLKPNGATFTSECVPDEAETEFLTSTDNWFRPVEARTAPDGSLWIVDMYRYVIEHSRWIPQNVQDELDVYAGNNLGRIYRILPSGAKPRSWPRLDKMNTPGLVSAMNSPNGWQRDMAQQLLVSRRDEKAADPLTKLAKSADHPAVRIQALHTLALLQKLPDDLLVAALSDSDAAVRRNAIQLAEPRLDSSSELLASAARLVSDSDAKVALQLACSLGATNKPEKINALADIAAHHGDDMYVLAGIMSSTKDDELGPLLKQVIAVAHGKPSPALTKGLMELAGAANSERTLVTAIDLAAAQAEQHSPNRFEAVDSLLSGLRRNQHSKEMLGKDSISRLEKLANKCASIASDDKTDVKTRAECIRILGRSPERGSDQMDTLANFLAADQDSQLQVAAVDALAERSQPAVAERLLSAWQSLTPALRAHVLDVLLTRKQWVGPLLAAIEAKNVQTSEIDAAHQARLTDYPDAELSKKAKINFAQSSAERLAVVVKYQPALKNGVAERGGAVFQKNCTPCHKFKGVGNEVGPSIAARQDKSNDGLLREILDPNRAVDSHYVAYVAVTTDGVVKTGILSEETGNAITLLGQNGDKIVLLRSQLESLTSSGKSLMPEGLEKQITPEEMADLIKFLATP